MHLNLHDNLSYIIRSDGEFVPAMPDDGEFSIQEIRDYVAGPPEVLCFTPDGYALFHNRDAKLKGLALNGAATSLQVGASGTCDSVLGRAFLAHPAHIPAFWKQSKLRNMIVQKDADHPPHRER
jgi:hypothetical protein